MVQSGAEGSSSEAAVWWRAAVSQAQRAMSVDMSSQASDSNDEYVDDDDEDAAEGDIKYYYDNDEDVVIEEPFDPEEYQFNCLTYRESQRVLTEEVNNVASALKVRVRKTCCVF